MRYTFFCQKYLCLVPSESVAVLLYHGIMVEGGLQYRIVLYSIFVPSLHRVMATLFSTDIASRMALVCRI